MTWHALLSVVGHGIVLLFVIFAALGVPAPRRKGPPR